MDTPQVLSKVKRKRGESDASAISSTTCKPPAKRKPEYMSHVEVARRPDELDVAATENPDQPYTQNANETHLLRNDMETQLDEASNSPVPNNIIVSQARTERRGNESGRRLNTTAADRPTVTSLRETIEMEFSLEILLKHNELRLIDQELAKCQVALEQLRRCQLIPFPVSTLDAGDMQAVSSGVGPAFGSSRSAQSPAPWGVTDGPYTRHYARWLIQDPVFDGDEPRDARVPHPAGKKPPERTTRGSKGDKAAAAFKSRSQRGTAGSRLQALPAGYPEPKEEKGPMIVKRSTDGKMVKLVCLNCRRENFNSAQGFINHCRIAHGRGFASHDAAALACGEKVEFNEAGGIISESVGGTSANAGLVHPLIRSAHVAALPSSSSHPKRKKPHSKSNSTSRVLNVANNVQDPSLRHSPSVVTPLNDALAHMPFVPSPQTPHLSALFAKAGRGGDLGEFVSEATTKTDVDMSTLSDEEDEDCEMEDAPEEDKSRSTRGPVHGGLVPARGVMSPAPLETTTISEGREKQIRKPGNLNNVSRVDHTSAYTTQDTASSNTVILSAAPPLNLSPNTIESNPAPSLVSDDDDDLEYPHTDSDASSSGPEDMDGDGCLVEVDNEEEVSGSSVDPELATAVKARAHSSSRKRSILRNAVPVGHDKAHPNRRVSFDSPGKENKTGGRKGK
ncbi:hypothetical protein MMC13_003917 [Lambiella insularis]|nr:hypothetical protein [Lambiella insularis]